MCRNGAGRGRDGAKAMTAKRFAVGLLTVSALGLASIKVHEAVVPVAYLDPVGIPTICAGHTRGVFLGQQRTLQECEELLEEDVTYAGRAIARCTKVDLTQGSYDALTSLVFNIGGTAYCASTLVRKLNAGDCRGAGREFDRWIYAKGRKLPGLIKRRAAERKLFETGCAQAIS